MYMYRTILIEKNWTDIIYGAWERSNNLTPFYMAWSFFKLWVYITSWSLKTELNFPRWSQYLLCLLHCRTAGQSPEQTRNAPPPPVLPRSSPVQPQKLSSPVTSTLCDRRSSASLTLPTSGHQRSLCEPLQDYMIAGISQTRPSFSSGKGTSALLFPLSKNDLSLVQVIISNF